MIEKIQIGGYEIEFDRDATAKCYGRIRTPGPEACACSYCLNWIRARAHILPPEFQSLLSRLGIPPDGEIEVWEVPGQKMKHLYGAWYFVVGRIVSGDANHRFEMGGFTVSFTSNKSYAVSEFEGEQICELEFYTEAEDYLRSEAL